MHAVLIGENSRARHDCRLARRVLKKDRVHPGLRFSFGALLLLGALARPAAAQTSGSVTVSKNQFFIERVEERSSGEYPLWINREDCLLDGVVDDGGTIIQVTPNVSPTGGQNLALQVWVGTGADCADPEEQRSTGRCWQVLNERPMRNNETYAISPRAVVAGKTDIDPTSEAVCNLDVSAATQFYFLLLDGSNIIASAIWKETQVDTRAPNPPTSVEASGGENKVFLEWTVPTTDEESDTQGYTFFCVPLGAPAIVDDAGNGGAAGAPPTLDADCPSNVLIPGELPPLDYRCGYATGRTVRNGQTADYGDDGGLVEIVNGTRYAIGISAADQIGNEGKLSDIVCATPEEVTSFFDRYTEAGGRGGGGYCGYSAVDMSGARYLAALVALAALCRFARSRGRAA